MSMHLSTFYIFILQLSLTHDATMFKYQNNLADLPSAKMQIEKKKRERDRGRDEKNNKIQATGSCYCSKTRCSSSCLVQQGCYIWHVFAWCSMACVYLPFIRVDIVKYAWLELVMCSTRKQTSILFKLSILQPLNKFYFSTRNLYFLQTMGISFFALLFLIHQSLFFFLLRNVCNWEIYKKSVFKKGFYFNLFSPYWLIFCLYRIS